jgi:hypothetical protein
MSEPSHTFKVKFRRRFDETMVVYCDESCHNAHRFFVVGGVYFLLRKDADVDKVLASIETQLQVTKDAYGLGTVKWEKVPCQPGKKLDGYKTYLRDFLETDEALFKCMVVDTRQYPLNNKLRWGGDRLVGYLKFYCVFLADGLMGRYPNYFFDFRLDQFEFRPDCGCDLLEQTTAMRFFKKKQPEPCLSYCSVRALNHRHHNLLQLVDLLVGAVSFVWNGGMSRISARASTRQELVRLIQEMRTVDLSKSTSLFKQDFNVWELHPNL